jgi:hypothetical protein
VLKKRTTEIMQKRVVEYVVEKAEYAVEKAEPRVVDSRFTISHLVESI